MAKETTEELADEFCHIKKPLHLSSATLNDPYNSLIVFSDSGVKGAEQFHVVARSAAFLSLKIAN